MYKRIPMTYFSSFSIFLIMVTRVIYIFCLIICQGYSQLCGPGIFPGPLPYEPGPFGPILGPLSQQGPCQPQLCNIPYNYNPGPIPCGQQPLVNIPSCQPAVNLPPFQPAPINPFNQPQPSCGLVPPLAISCQPEANPVVTTTVVDNTLANTLANAIQLLILSNLLESSSTLPCTSYAPAYEVPVACNNIIDITPDYYPCNQIVTCEQPIYEFAPYLETCYQEPIVTFAPCVEVNPCAQVASFAPVDTCAYNPYGNVGFDSCGFNALGNLGCFDNVNPYGNNFGCRDNCVNTYPGIGLDNLFSPVAAEIVFPAEIPAQMVCNFGYMPANVPCVSVNVEPLPFDSCSCNNIFY